jgi:hypothetical protein
MKQFECINTFTSSKGEYYAKGAKIYENEYYKLSGPDKANFKEVYSDMEEFQSPKSKDDRFADLQDDGQWNTKGDYVDEGAEVMDELFGSEENPQDDGF